MIEHAKCKEMASSLQLRQRFVEIAQRDVGIRETSRNRGPGIAKFWPATSYGAEGYQNREPYCAAALCYWLQQWLKDGDVRAALGKTPAQAEKWRCKTAGAWAWEEWANAKGVRVVNANTSAGASFTLHTADIVIYDFSHIGLIYDDKGTVMSTIEANTGLSGERDGDGVWEKKRARSLAKRYLRILP